MSKIRVDLSYTIFEGAEVSFKAPVDCSHVDGIRIYFPDADKNFTHKDFLFVDAHGEDVTNLEDLFAEGSIVKVILDTDGHVAYIQNADTNSYIEKRLAGLAATTHEVVAYIDDWVFDGIDKYTCTLNVDGILPTDNPIADVISLDLSGAAMAQTLSEWSKVMRITTDTNKITLLAYPTAPITNLRIQLKVVR